MDPAQTLQKWTVQDSADLYNVIGWSGGYFSVNEQGHVQVHPRANGAKIDLYELVRDLQKRGFELPLLIRFPDILDQQITRLNESFQAAIAEYGYAGSYRSVYPVKVNQQAHVVEEIASFGKRYQMGLEVGSKPELLIALSVIEADKGLIICNGYKDAAFLETALLAQRMGFTVVIVLERLRELSTLLDVAGRLGIEPTIGVRCKLAARGRGKWTESAGERAKFGLRVSDIQQVLQTLRERNMLSALRLLHFHIGSQVTAIRAIADALREASNLYVDLVKAGAAMGYFDVGGGLAVDYDGSKSNFDSSANYSMREYASCVVDMIQSACKESDAPAPTIISESGRALVSHMSVLVMGVLDAEEVRVTVPTRAGGQNEPRVIANLYETLDQVSAKNFQESYHDAIYSRDEAIALFNHGMLSLKERAQAEEVFWACCDKILRIMRNQESIPEEMEVLERLMADTYYCNVSFFQSLPDTWAIKHIFPTMPIMRLNEEPTRRAVLADVTCDSDGRIDHFADPRDVKRVLELHTFSGDPYVIGVFLCGAYQEILGDLHNLFGDTTAVHVYVAENGYRIGNVVEGDSMAEVLSYVQYNRTSLMEGVRRDSEKALEAGLMNLEQARLLRMNLRNNLEGYTYLISDEIE
jgi:arginine decarboxylase